MIDENLPTFVLKPSTEKPKELSTYLFSQRGSAPEPSYSLRHPNPDQQGSRNRYAAALYDAFNPDVLFAEVLLIPDWTGSTTAAEQIRVNGNVPPPPEPILPTEFTIQLYNPDQQIVVRQKSKSFGTPSWQFEMPQRTFRPPSASTLDKTQNDPAASELTPKIAFKWKKESKLNKDLVCFLSGKTTSPDGRKKGKEPDITIAIFQGMKELTLYEPNLQRVDIEDLKGFEVALLLGSVVIRDVYFGQMKEVFNLGPRSRSTSQTTSPVVLTASGGLPPLGGIPAPLGPSRKASSGRNNGPDSRVPPTDPWSQWDIDAETERLKRQEAAEERERKRIERERKRQEEAEQKQIKDMLMAEEKENRRKQAERQALLDRETEELRQRYGQEDSSARPTLPPRNAGPYRHSSYEPQAPIQSQPHYQPGPVYQPPPWNTYQQRQQPPPPPPPIVMHNAQPPFGGGYLTPQPVQQQQQQQRLKPKSSFFGFRRGSDEEPRLQKKRSAVF